MARCDVIVWPPLTKKLKMVELARWAWEMGRVATLRDTKSGNSLVILEPINQKRLSIYNRFFNL